MFIMRKFWIGLLLLLFALPTRAQIPWEAAFYVELSSSPFSAELRLYRSDGETTVIPLPSNLSHGDNVEARRTVLVSDYRRYVVMSEYRSEPFAALPLRIADLQSGTCCVEVAALDAVDAYEFATFEPGGSRFALSYLSTN